MSIRYAKRKFHNIIAMLLLASIMIMPFLGQWTTSFQSHSASDVSVTTVTSSCSHSKMSQSQTGRNCQSQSGGFQLYSILPNFLLFFASITGKIIFIFILGLLALSHPRRIDKPPRAIAI